MGMDKKEREITNIQSTLDYKEHERKVKRLSTLGFSVYKTIYLKD